MIQVKNVHSFSRKLGYGEQEALSLALQQSAHILLMDDRKGYNEAKEHHLVVASTRAILKIAEKRGLIDSYHAVEDALRTRSFYVPNY
jgi:predicted nucleic acid-binding protein